MSRAVLEPDRLGEVLCVPVAHSVEEKEGLALLDTEVV